MAPPQLKRLVAGFPPRRPGFDPGSGQVGFVVNKVALGRVFSEYFGFPCQSSFHQILHHHNHPGQATIGQTVAAVPSGPSWTLPPSELKKNWNTTTFSFLTVMAFLTWFNFTRNKRASVQVVEVQL
jgi:hypothetical protein